ncbi:permease (plasmid) [Gemmatirosa kalamazoonensis]|uniref:Permease n=1 Tax=Gemmatirosa kalamazoonensis TaxID=861299 RepID=W0RRY6_9BACT|nr:ABC transporter permease [Gemmatirosa kalamazoonensis]AHG93090.1 permease [Gemmatirosa kalamazoonensis]
MSLIRPRVRRLFRLAVRRPALRERDVDDEIRLHIDLRAEQLVREGWSPEAARVEAERRFAALLDDARGRLLEAARHRDTRMGWGDRLESVRHDLAFALRQLRAARAVTAAAVLTIALGIGANATMFGIVDRLLLRPPPHVADAARVARLYLERGRGAFNNWVDPSVGYPTYRAVRDDARGFAAVAAYFPSRFVVGEGAQARQLRTTEVTGNFFAMLGTRAQVGRLLGPDDDRVPSGSRVVVLGDGYWRRVFGGDPAAVGRSLVVEGQRYVVVGVAPRGFTGVDLEPVDLFLPLSATSWHMRGHDWAEQRNMAWIRMVGRLRAGVTRTDAARDVTAALRRAVTDTNSFDYHARALATGLSDVRGLNESGRRTSGAVAAWLTGVAAVVLLIACANVANLLLARAVRRRREIAVRTALGAGRWRLARQLLTESALLAVLGGVLGLAVARWGGALVRTALLPDVDWSQGVVSARVLLLAVGATAVTALLIGLAPVLHLASSGAVAGLRTGVREGGGRQARLRGALLVAQAALSVVLLVGAGLFVRSLDRIGALDFGYDTERLLLVDPSFPEDLPMTARLAAYDRLLERLRHTPGVERAALATTSPFWSAAAGDLAIPGFDSLAALRDQFPHWNAVSDDYFETMGTHIVRGRALAATDVRGAPRVALVNEAMARRIWKGADPIGRCLKIGGDTVPCSEIVGVVRNTIEMQLRETPVLQYFYPLAQGSSGNSMRALVARTAPGVRPASLVSTLRRALRPVAPEARYVEVLPFTDRVDPQVRPWRLGATMFTAFGALALLIAAVGLYSVMAYGVAQRLHEMGLRMALGARAADVVRLLLRQAMGVVGLGLVAGGVAALAAGHWVAPLLFDVSPRDPLVFGAVAAVLAGTALAATAVPARRATRANPSDALRSE